jgi:3-mercaptopyruvate sulfurtransferase SseA
MWTMVRAMVSGLSGVLLAAACPAAGGAYQQSGRSQVEVDPKSGRAVGAREMQPDELRKLIARNSKTIIIDVRDKAQFEEETIKGAIHIPFPELEARLQEIPKDTTLVFT